jgi:hypothetical protein
MEGAPNDGTSADPTMTPIERQMQVIATSIQDLARETSRQNQELWQAIRKGPPTPHDNNQPPPRGGNRSNDQEADSHQVTRRRETKLRELRPAAGTERKAQEVPLHLANARQLKQRGRPNSQNDQIGRPSSLNEKIDEETPPDNLIIQIDPQEIRMTKRRVWRKNCEK